MAADALAALGLELRAEADAWLAALTPDALPDGTAAARELFQALGALEAEVADAAANEVELTRLQAWLTSGFFAPPEPYAPADAVVAEVMDEARRRETPPEAESVGPVASPASAPNEFAAGSSQRPPAPTVASGPLRRPGGVTHPPAPADARRAVDPADSGRDGGSAAPAVALRDEWTAASADSRRARGDDPRPAADRRGGDGGGGSAAGGIQGLAALAAFAGNGGIEIPPPQDDADRHPHAPEPPRGRADRAAREPESERHGWPAHPVDVDHADAAPSPSSRSSVEVRPPASADRSVKAGPAREVDQREGDAAGLPPRIIRAPVTTPPAERMGDTDEGWIAAAPLPIPFLTPPGEAEQHDTRAEFAFSQPTSDARQPLAWPAHPVDVDRADAAPSPSLRSSVEVRPSASADRSVKAGPAREVDQREGDAVRLPPRIIRVPFTAQSAERMEDADEGWIAAAPLPIPFLTPPGEAEQHDTQGESAFRLPPADARPPLALPSMRVFDGAGNELPPGDAMPTPDARRAMESEWAGFGEPAETSEAFLARAARVAGQRLRPAAEIVGGEVASAAQMPSTARTPPSAPAESRTGTRLIDSPDAATAGYPIVPSATVPAAYPTVASATEPDAHPTVWTREAAAVRPAEGMEWPAPDVTDLLDALASEIAHEYRRYYGE